MNSPGRAKRTRGRILHKTRAPEGRKITVSRVYYIAEGLLRNQSLSRGFVSLTPGYSPEPIRGPHFQMFFRSFGPNNPNSHFDMEF